MVTILGQFYLMGSYICVLFCEKRGERRGKGGEREKRREGERRRGRLGEREKEREREREGG